MSLSTILAEARYPSVEPEFATYAAWFMFALVALVALLAWLRIDSVRRSLLALEDPRVFAVLRIGFAIMTFVCFLNLHPYWRFLWSDEGIFDLEYAQDKLGRTALRGWDPTEGFYDTWAILNFLWNKPSLFYFWGSPSFVDGYMWSFFFVLLLYGLGAFSRVTGVLAWFLMSGIYNRNSLYWEGTDTVYRCFWFILLFARTGHAWSIDNWWRCRWLRARGRLQNPDAPAEDDATKQPIYRLVPSWPRWLFMAQLAGLYISTGAVKTGDVWAAGDALYYALNMDHFYRLEWLTQQASAIFGTNVFRLMTWVTHWWERLFPIVLIGVSLHFTVRHRDQPWYIAQDVWWRRWGARLTLVAIWLVVWRLNYLVLPVCLPLVGDEAQSPEGAWRKIHIVYGVIVPMYAATWYALGRWPIMILRGGRDLGPLTRRWSWLRVPELRLDQESFRAWTLGRRVWLVLGFTFHGFLILFMNIGMFPFIMLMTYAAFVSGEEHRRIWRAVTRGLAALRITRWMVPKHYERAFVPAADATMLRPRGRTIPNRIVLALGLLFAYLCWTRATDPHAFDDGLGMWTKTWFVVLLAVAVFYRLRPATTAELALARASGPAMAYGAVGRTFAFGFVAYHTLAVMLQLWPTYAVFGKWRNPVRQIAETGEWLKGTATSQSWEMFAPNPPRSNLFLKTVVVEADGDRWDLRNNAYHYRPNPWIWNDRMRKMHRRMAGKGKWYLRYWAEFQCREWEIETGEAPVRVDMYKIVTRIPTPDMVAEKGPYHPRKLKATESPLQDNACDPGGRLPLFMKERYGLPVTDEDIRTADRAAERYEKSFNTRREQWDKRKDWGRWWDAEDEAEEKRREAQERRRSRDEPSPGVSAGAPAGTPGGADDEPDAPPILRGGDEDGE